MRFDDRYAGISGRSTLRLTKRIADGLKPGGKDAVFRDRDLAGFGVRVHATGRKLHIVRSRGPEAAVADPAEPCPKDHVAARCKPGTARNCRMSIECHFLPAAANQAIRALSKMLSPAGSREMHPPGRNPCRHVRQYRDIPASAS